MDLDGSVEVGWGFGVHTNKVIYSFWEAERAGQTTRLPDVAGFVCLRASEDKREAQSTHPILSTLGSELHVRQDLDLSSYHSVCLF